VLKIPAFAKRQTVSTNAMTTIKQRTFYILTITFALLTIKPTDSFAKGKAGSYILTGLAISRTGDTLKSQQILMYFKDKVDTLQTDSKGYYKTTIHWATACPSGVTPWQRRRATKKNNPKYIFFAFRETKIKIKNEWKSFVSADFNNPDSRTKKENLVF
jgi:hypothetical protein